jgi:hypothetical protein
MRGEEYSRALGDAGHIGDVNYVTRKHRNSLGIVS